MPGPMGGGRGGGFSTGSRGGGFGGGSRGGGYRGGPRGPMHHGPHHHGPHHHHHGPIFFGPRWHGPHHHGGGGCFGALAAAALIPLIFIVIIGMLIIGSTAGIFESDEVRYNDPEFQSYANEQYEMAFSGTDDYENNILLVFLVHDGYEVCDCIAWGGYNIDAETDELFGSYLQSTVKNAIPEYYEYALTKSFRQVITKMTVAAPENSVGTVDTRYSMLYNYTELEIDREIIDAALQGFTEKTGYPIAIVVENEAEVFGDKNDGMSDVAVAFLVIFVVIIAVLIIAFIKSKKNNGGGGNGGNKTTDKTNPDAGQGKYDPNTGEWK